MINDAYSYFSYKAAQIRDEIQDLSHAPFHNLGCKCGFDNEAIIKIKHCLQNASNEMRIACQESCNFYDGDCDE